MMIRSLILLAVFASVALCAPPNQSQSQCLNRFKQYGQCVLQNKPSPFNDADLKKAYDQCFTKNGCTPTPPPSKEDKLKCTNSFKKELGDDFKQCMKRKGVSVPDDDHHDGAPPEPYAQLPPTVPPAQCSNNKKKADQVKSCLEQARRSHLPSKKEAKAKFDAICKMEKKCKKQLPKGCEAPLRQAGTAFCECVKQLKPQIIEVIKNNPSCMKLPPNPEIEPDNCKKIQTPCEEGFEKFYQKITSGGKSS